MTYKYKLLEPMLGWAEGELFVLDTEWGEWKRKRTGETFCTRGSIISNPHQLSGTTNRG